VEFAYQIQFYEKKTTTSEARPKKKAQVMVSATIKTQQEKTSLTAPQTILYINAKDTAPPHTTFKKKPPFVTQRGVKELKPNRRGIPD